MEGEAGLVNLVIYFSINYFFVCAKSSCDIPCLLGLEAVYRDGEAVGHLRRGEFAFHLDKPVGFAYIGPGGEEGKN